MRHDVSPCLQQPLSKQLIWKEGRQGGQRERERQSESERLFQNKTLWGAMTFLTSFFATPLQNSYPCFPITHTQKCPSRRDRFKCHAALPHNMRLKELILPSQDRRSHIAHTLNCHMHTQTLSSIKSTHVSAATSQCCDVFSVGLNIKRVLLFKVHLMKKISYRE